MPIRSVRPKRAPVFVCRKCLKRSTDAKLLGKTLKRETKAAGGKLVPIACVGLCPKKAVVVATAESLGRGRFLLLNDASDVPATVRNLAAFPSSQA